MHHTASFLSLTRAGPCALALAVLGAGLVPAAYAGPLRDRLAASRSADRGPADRGPADRGPADVFWDDDGADSTRSGPAAPLPPGTQVLRNLAYGPDRLQRMDIYLPEGARSAPVLFLVHGGGWRRGDKAHDRLVDNKLAHWLPRGVVVVSINYRMLPDAPPDAQARDVAQALAWAQQQAGSWGADAGRFVLMGHSAGAHLAALVAGDPARLRAAGALAPQAVVLLDSGALDVPQIMNARHARLFDQAFGSDPAVWRRVSPQHQLEAGMAPALLVCSAPRRSSCEQAEAYARKNHALGAEARVLAERLSHGQINEQLGLPGAYTEAVDAFLARHAHWPLQ